MKTIELPELNAIRREIREGLILTQNIDYIEGGHLYPEKKFRIHARIANCLVPGSGGAGQGDARFRNLRVTVRGTPFARVLQGKDKGRAEGNELLLEHSSPTLAEGEVWAFNVWLEAVKPADRDAPEKVARFDVSADFDIERYFHLLVSDETHANILP